MTTTRVSLGPKGCSTIWVSPSRGRTTKDIWTLPQSDLPEFITGYDLSRSNNKCCFVALKYLYFKIAKLKKSYFPMTLSMLENVEVKFSTKTKKSIESR